MLKPVVACSHTHWHRFAYLSGQCIAQMSRELYVDACGCMRPQANTQMSLLVWAMRRPESREIYADAFGNRQPQASV